MLVKALDHVNIVAADLDRSARFYAELLDLEPRSGPPPLGPQQVRWMHDGEGRAILHLNSVDCRRAFDRAFPAGAETGAIHHVALACTDSGEIVRRLEAMDRPHTVSRIESIRLTQVFTHDPDGVLLELNCFDA